MGSILGLATSKENCQSLIQVACARPPTPSFMKVYIEWIDDVGYDETVNHVSNQTSKQSLKELIKYSISHIRSVNQTQVE